MSEETKIVTEASAIESKIQEIQTKYNEVVGRRNEIVKQIKGCDEEIMKLTGAYQSLMELKESLNKKEAPEQSPVVETKE